MPLLVLLAAAASTDRAEWPQFRGAGRDGAAAGVEPLAAWPEGGPRLVWRRPIGSGFSGISVAGGRFFTLFAEGEREFAAAFDAESGEELWRTDIGARFQEQFGDGPRSTPTVAGGVVYALGARGRLAALSADVGSPLWQRELTEAFGSQPPIRGFATSPLVDGELVLLRVGGGEGAAYVALDRSSGETRWTLLDGNPGYSSLIAAEPDGVRQYVSAASAEILALSPGGELIWSYEWAPGTIAMPLLIPPDRIFVSASYDVGAVLLEVEGGTAVRELWRNRIMKSHFSSAVHLEDHVYGFDGATLKAVSLAGGAQRWAKRGFGKGSLILTGRDLIVLSDRGRLALVEASPEGYREKSSFQAMSGKCWTAPSLAGSRLYLRNLTEMASFDLAAAGGGE